MRGYKGNYDINKKRTGRISAREYYEMIHEQKMATTVEPQILKSKVIAPAGSFISKYPEYPY